MTNNIPQTPEAIAFALLERVFNSENKKMFSQEGKVGESRESILDTYAECLTAVKGHRTVKTSRTTSPANQQAVAGWMGQ